MSVLLPALWPLFVLLLLGGGLRYSGFPGDAFWGAAERLNYFLLFPALLFHHLAKAPFDDPALGQLALGVALGLGAGWLGLLGLRRLTGWSAARFGVFVQSTLRFNTYLGLALVAALGSANALALAAVMLALLVPSVNLLSVWALSAERHLPLRALLRPLASNPLILACLAGIAASLINLPLPPGSDRLLSMLGSASLPLGLLCVGAALKPSALRGTSLTLLLASAARLLAMPLLALAIARLLALPASMTGLLVLFFALPTAPTAYVLTRQLGGDAELMAGLITLQTLLSVLTLPLMLVMLTL
ncbi:AEC family transporter [Kushneria phosphatilytica]|uniref:AEC family transporter n=1 Tax=Kushneria phosphatilytica TaxID=657387 RepID=A0A1S1NTS7_9GAMM|nr:AEC family transporter [Kushneria phosphatilytica]OHV08880.1 transporter [Kushneria phosphatilytica]QEL12601.1 AEC family transporter [Kushneria phosphatilytica]